MAQDTGVHTATRTLVHAKGHICFAFFLVPCLLKLWYLCICILIYILIAIESDLVIVSLVTHKTHWWSEIALVRCSCSPAKRPEKYCISYYNVSVSVYVLQRIAFQVSVDRNYIFFKRFIQKMHDHQYEICGPGTPHKTITTWVGNRERKRENCLWDWVRCEERG